MPNLFYSPIRETRLTVKCYYPFKHRTPLLIMENNLRNVQIKKNALKGIADFFLQVFGT